MELEGWVLRLVPEGVAPKDFARRLREAEPPVVGRVEDDALVLDLRTVLPDEDEALVKVVRGACS